MRPNLRAPRRSCLEMPVHRSTIYPNTERVGGSYILAGYDPNGSAYA